MESSLVGLLACAWYEAYLSYLSVKDFEFLLCTKAYLSYLSVKAFEFLSLYLLALFEQLFEASQIDNLAQTVDLASSLVFATFLAPQGPRSLASL